MSQETVVVPDIGGSEAAEVVEVLIDEGDVVAVEQGLLVLESDKASMEIPSSVAGTVVKVLAKLGDALGEGAAVAVIEVDAADAAPEAGEKAAAQSAPEAESEPEPESGQETEPEPEPEPELEESPKPSAQAGDDNKGAGPGSSAGAPRTPATAVSAGSETDSESSAAVYAGPAVRRLAREFAITLSEVNGSGPRGRVLKEDLHKHSQRKLDAQSSGAAGAGIPTVPDVDFAAFGPVEIVERSKIDKLTAASMQRSWLNVPHVTQFDDADITEMEAFRSSLKAEAAARDTRLTPLPFLLKACAVALEKHEKINASLSDGGQTLTFKRYIHIGIAVDTPAGLVVPVIRDVNKKTLWELAKEVLDLAGRARDRKLKPGEMQGGGFSISSLGAIGGRGFTPIVNTPEVAILGVGRSSTQPVWDGQAFQPRLQLPLALSYDHRVVNGGDAGRFMTELCGLLGDIRRLLL